MDLEGEASGDIFEVLRIHQPQLEVLEFPGNQLNRRMFTGVEELTNLLRDSNQLHTLNISHNGIVGESLQEGLLQYLGKLSCLNLSYNMLSINDFDGYQAIAALLEDPSCNLHELVLNGSNIQGERLRSFARAMTKNKTLMILDLSRNAINDADWAVFSDVLCNTSSVNNTYKSNHTLWQLVKDGPVISFQGAHFHQNQERLPGLIPEHLDLNKYDDKKKVAAMKILQYSRHNITMLPFFEWELSCLPIAVNWFDNAAPYYRRPPVFRKEVETSKLQAIYEFVRDMPAECADGYFGRNKKGGKKRARS